MSLSKTTRSCAPPAGCGSRSTTISPAPESARKISPFGATVSQRGCLKFAANTVTRNPGGTVGRKPSGGFTRRGPLPAELVAHGTGSFGLWPCVTCADARAGRKNEKAKARILLARIAVAFQKTELLIRSLGCLSRTLGSIYRRIPKEHRPTERELPNDGESFLIQHASIRIQSNIERVN